MGGSISKKNSEPDRLSRIGDGGQRTSSSPNSPAMAGQSNSVAVDEISMTDQPTESTDIVTTPTSEQQVVPTVFRWEHGGNQVYITGTFNNWTRKVPMHRSGNDFIYIQSLTKGKHAYKFVVDDEWRFAPDQPTVADASENINNYIDLTNFKPDETIAPTRRESRDEDYGHEMPDDEEYTKEPPLLPPHLRQIVLNAPSPDIADPLRLQDPQYVTLNHLFCTAIKDGLMVQAISHRYRRKHSTTVYYTVMPMSSSLSNANRNPTVPLQSQQDTPVVASSISGIVIQPPPLPHAPVNQYR